MDRVVSLLRALFGSALQRGREFRARQKGSLQQDGVSIPADDPNLTERVLKVMREGKYEIGDVTALKELAEPDDVVMEVGGGIGFVSAVAAKLVGSERVHTYEPNPALEASIRRLHRLNNVAPQVTVAAVAATSGNAKLQLAPDFWDSRITLGGENVEVPTLAFSDELSRIQPNLLLIDCEGSELTLIEGTELPTSVRKVVVELHPEYIGLDGCTTVVRALLDQRFLLRLDLCGGSMWAFVRDR
jgi:FkbM family methyltransferase